MSDARVHTYIKDKNNPWDEHRAEKYIKFMMNKNFKTLGYFYVAVIEKKTNELTII